MYLCMYVGYVFIACDGVKFTQCILIKQLHLLLRQMQYFIYVHRSLKLIVSAALVSTVLDAFGKRIPD